MALGRKTKETIEGVELIKEKSDNPKRTTRENISIRK
jgi:hypothetical protein